MILILRIIGSILDGTEIGEILYILTPLIQFIINKWLGEDDSEIAEFDYSKENDEQIPWENAQPFKPDENPFLAEPEKQKEEEKTKETDSLTGGAANMFIDYEIESFPEISGVKRGKPMSPEDAGGKNVNPGFYNSDDIGYQYNCTFCVPIHRARELGYDIEALPINKDIIDAQVRMLLKYPYFAFKESKEARPMRPIKIRSNNIEECKQQIEKIVKPGQVYEFWSQSVDMDEGISHVLEISRNENNEIKFYDPQRGKFYGEEYYEQMKYTRIEDGTIQYFPQFLFRIDNLDLNYELLNKISRPTQRKSI